jgi:acetylornithine/N-succinyldiaminopimelate aminotransferase
MCAAGVAVVQSLLAEEFLPSGRTAGQQLAAGLVALSQEFALGEVRGQGLLLALELNADIAVEVVERAREMGLLLNAPRSHCLRFMPALNTTPAEIQEGLQLLRYVIQEIGSQAPAGKRQDA